MLFAVLITLRVEIFSRRRKTWKSEEGKYIREKENTGKNKKVRKKRRKLKK
jgi:hypothetical protein